MDGEKPPLRHGAERGAHPLHPVPHPHHHGHRHCVPGPDQRRLLHRLPGDNHPHHAAHEGGLHIEPHEVADLHRLGQLVPDAPGHLHHAHLPEIREPGGGLRSGGHRHHDHHRHHDDDDLRPYHQEMESPHRHLRYPGRFHLSRLQPQQTPPWRLLVDHSRLDPLHYHPHLDPGTARPLSRPEAA